MEHFVLEIIDMVRVQFCKVMFLTKEQLLLGVV
jgi:hypothetical protein